MYVGSTRGYSSDADQQTTGILDYVVTDTIGNNDSTGSAGLLDYMILDRMGYFSDSTGTPSSVLDYLPDNRWGNQRDVIQYTTGVIDYVLDQISSNVIIEQERGWGFNWELITLQWETINDNWNNG